MWRLCIVVAGTQQLGADVHWLHPPSLHHFSINMFTNITIISISINNNISISINISISNQQYH